MAVDLAEKIYLYARGHADMKPGKHWILAVSGGPDSMVLMDVFAHLASRMDAVFTVVHVNHQLRPEADGEQEFVEIQAGKRGLDCVSFRKNVRNLKKNGMSLEECARMVRYDCLRRVCRKEQAAGIVTAHHQDDAAETVLLHLLRGTGLNGLRGMRPVRGDVVRPMLGVSRDEIMMYLQDKKIPYCLDLSNDDLYYTRNRIRGVLLPLLKEQFNPRIVPALNRLADLAEEDELALQAWTGKVWGRVCRNDSNGDWAVDVAELLALPVGIQRRAVRRVLANFGGAEGWTASDIEDVLRLCTKSGSDRQITLKKGVYCRKVYQNIYFSLRDKLETGSFCVPVMLPGIVRVPEIGRSYRFSFLLPDEIPGLRRGLCLDAARLPKDLVLRSRLPGDRFAPAGGAGKKKLKDWMIDHKIPAGQRNQIPLLADLDGRVLAVAGLAVSRDAAVSENSECFLCWEDFSSF